MWQSYAYMPHFSIKSLADDRMYYLSKEVPLCSIYLTQNLTAEHVHRGSHRFLSNNRFLPSSPIKNVNVPSIDASPPYKAGEALILISPHSIWNIILAIYSQDIYRLNINGSCAHGCICLLALALACGRACVCRCVCVCVWRDVCVCVWGGGGRGCVSKDSTILNSGVQRPAWWRKRYHPYFHGNRRERYRWQYQ